MHPLLSLAAASLLLTAGAASARSFISPMGEPFRDTPDGRAPAEAWFAGADRDGDGRITRAEFLADAGRFFRLLDVDHDGEIGPEEIDRYENDVAPEVRTGGFSDAPSGRGSGGRGGHGGGHHRGGGVRGGSGDEGRRSDDAGGAVAPSYDSVARGAARFGYLDLPEPVIAADTDFNRGVSVKEWLAAAQQRFLLLDADHNGVLTRGELPRLRGSDDGGARRGGHRRSGRGPDAGFRSGASGQSPTDAPPG